MKKTIRDRYRLEVFVELWPCTDPEHEEYVQALNRLQQSVRRHVDEVGVLNKTWDTKEICGFCGCEWEIWEKEDKGELKKGMPVCCQEAQEEEEAK